MKVNIPFDDKKINEKIFKDKILLWSVYIKIRSDIIVGKYVKIGINEYKIIREMYCEMTLLRRVGEELMGWIKLHDDVLDKR